MGIFSRTRDIFAANFTELLDRAEDPARMIRMIILEMEETLVEVRASAARSIADGKEMRRAISRLDELQNSWTEKAELALSKDREDLAKAALMERQKAVDMADGLRAEISVIEETLVEVRASAARSIADGKEMRRAVNRLDEMQASWTEKAELALSKDREDLAKAALVERQKAADMAEGLRAELASIDETLKAYEADIAKLQGKLREARARQNAIATRIESAVTRAKARELLHGGRTEDAFSRFEVLERRADFAEGRADALGMTGPKSLEEEIAELKAAEKVDAELVAMKAAIAARSK